MIQKQHREPQSQIKNIFPLHLIAASQGSQIMIELKNGDTYNGTLQGVDKYMNLKISNAVCTSKSPVIFHQMPQIYIKGNSIRFFTFQQDCLQKITKTSYKAPQKWKTAIKNDKKLRKEKK